MSDKQIKRFSTLNREQVPFVVDDVEYVIKQASSDASTIYREASLKNAEMEFSGEGGDEKRVMRKLQGIAGLEPLLVSLCTYHVKENVLVQKALVDAWPGEITRWAFEEVKRISPWLDERGEDLPA